MAKGWFFLLAATATSPAYAIQGTGIQVGGANVAAQANAVTNVTVGTGSSTQSSLGSVMGDTHVSGKVTAVGQVVAQTAVSLGINSNATTLIGTVADANVRGDAQAVGSATTLTAVTVRPFSRTCAAVGVVGPGQYGSVSATGTVGNAIVFDIGFGQNARLNVGTVGHPC